MRKSFRAVLRVALPLFVLSPYILGFSPNPADSSTVFRFAFGRGYYTHETYDCNSGLTRVQEASFEEVAIAVDHPYNEVRIGAKVGVLHTAEDVTDFSNSSVESERVTKTEKKKYVLYLNPTLSTESENFGFSLGPIFMTGGLPPADLRPIVSAKIRIGNLDAWYATASFANSIPLFTGGGLTDFGLGTNLEELRSEVWAGLAFYPYSRTALSLKGSIPVNDSFFLSVNGQLPIGKRQLDGNERNAATGFEYGFSIGGKIVF